MATSMPRVNCSADLFCRSAVLPEKLNFFRMDKKKPRTYRMGPHYTLVFTVLNVPH